MSLINVGYFFNEVLKDKVPEENINSSGVLIYELKIKFGYDLLDICEMFYKCPTLLFNIKKVIQNILTLSQSYKLNDVELRYIFKKLPFLLLINPENFRYKTSLISATFGCSIKDSIKLITMIPELIDVSKNYIITQNKIFTEALNEYGLKYRRLLRQEPKLLFINKENFDNCKQILMKYFSLSETESQTVLINSPSLLIFGEDELLRKFNFYYPKFFIKRDLKEILVKCPSFLNLSEFYVEKKINELKSSFNLNEKKSCEFIREEPYVLFFKNLTSRINSFIKFNINPTYVLSSPKMCLALDVSLPLKFIITRIVNLEEEFNEICEMDSNLFISRFLFMQSNSLYEFKDLILKENDFYSKYNISTQVLKNNYTINYLILKNICSHYVNIKEKIKNWSDVIFPNFEDILEFIHSGYAHRYNKIKLFEYQKETSMLTKREIKIYKLLSSLQLSTSEILFIIDKNNIFEKYINTDIKKIIDELRKIGYTQEEIAKLMMFKSYLFNYNIIEFFSLIEEISTNEMCSVKDVIEKFL